MKAGRCCIDCLPYRLGTCQNTTGGHDITVPSQSTLPSLENSSGVSRMSLTDVESPLALGTTNLAFYSSPADTNEHLADDLLPAFTPAVAPSFTWGEVDADTFMSSLCSAYSEVVSWRKNCFKVPQGNCGIKFVSELARLFEAFASRSALEPIALRAAIVLPLLLLQKPSRNSKPKDHQDCLKRRLDLWKDGNLHELLREGRAIQYRLVSTCKLPSQNIEKQLTRTFTKLMFEGKTHAALQLLSDSGKGGFLSLDAVTNTNSHSSEFVRDVLKRKHPPSKPICSESVIQGQPPNSHPVVFDSLDATLIRSVALHTSGAAGPSYLDAFAWRRLCTSFQRASVNLCKAIAGCARRIACEFIDPKCISPLLACRLVALDKCPGVRPIGIGEIPRRIMGKAILLIVRDDVRQAAGSMQLCAGQVSGVEAAVHAIKDIFQKEETEAVLLVDADNAFNSLNRRVALHNVRFTCPPLATTLINTYRCPSELFIENEVIMSQEGVTQGDPLAMPFYALSTLPLIEKLPPILQVWYADDASASGNVSDLKTWWDELNHLGPGYGYITNASKTWLVTKSQYYSAAKAVFQGTNVNVTCEGRPYLGSPLGTADYIQQYVKMKVASWNKELILLSSIALAQPQAAYAAYTHGLSSRWSYLARTTRGISHLFVPLEDTLRNLFFPAITGQPSPNDDLRNIFALPARCGGLGMNKPELTSVSEYESSLRICRPLIDLILKQDSQYHMKVFCEQLSLRKDVKCERTKYVSAIIDELRQSLSVELKRGLLLASEKGASVWLTCLPIKEFGFCLHRRAFLDSLALRYGWSLSNTPLTCACGTSFSVNHALSCSKGGFPLIRHNEIRDLTAQLLTEVCNNVRLEPDLQPVHENVSLGASVNSTDGARLDIAVNGFWGGRYETTFLDVRIFNPYADSNRSTSLTTTYLKHENEKRRTYESRVREVEHASFTPLVMSATGGMAKQATVFYKHLASLLADKRDTSYSATMNWLRCTISFSLLRSAIQCVRGARSSYHSPDWGAQIDFVIAQSHLT